MKKFMQKNWGTQAFTLVELMIVVTIVAILALIAIPLYSANTTASIMSEGISGAGTIRTALRIYYAQNATYAGATLPTGGTQGTLQIGVNDLNGKYFKQTDYTLPTVTASTYLIQAGPPTQNATVAARLAGTYYSIDENGSEQGTFYTNQ